MFFSSFCMGKREKEHTISQSTGKESFFLQFLNIVISSKQQNLHEKSAGLYSNTILSLFTSCFPKRNIKILDYKRFALLNVLYVTIRQLSSIHYSRECVTANSGLLYTFLDTGNQVIPTPSFQELNPTVASSLHPLRNSATGNLRGLQIHMPSWIPSSIKITFKTVFYSPIGIPMSMLTL